MLARRDVDLDEDHFLDRDPRRSLGEVGRPMRPVEMRNARHPRKAQLLRVEDVDMGVDDREIRQGAPSSFT
jgi:hypothetical protein